MASQSVSPFPLSLKSPGHGLIHVQHLPPSMMTLSQLEFTYPLKLICSSKATDKYLIIFILSYGGGLVSNDKVDLNVVLEENVKLCLLTQGSTKIFRLRPNDTLTSQNMTVHIAPHSSLLLLPDPVQPFAQSVYSQHQKFYIPKGNTASLIILDWFTEGRTSRGEKWGLSMFASRNEIFEVGEPEKGREMLFVDGRRLLLRDSLALEGDDVDHRLDEEKQHRAVDLNSRMDGLSCFATLMIRGPKFAKLCHYILRSYQTEPRIGGAGVKGWDSEENVSPKQKVRENVIWTAAEIRGFIVVKCSGKELEAVRKFLKDLLLEGQPVTVFEKMESPQVQPDILREFDLNSLRCLE